MDAAGGDGATARALAEGAVDGFSIAGAMEKYVARGLGLPPKGPPKARQFKATPDEIGNARESRVAELSGGRVVREQVKTPFGSTETDVIGPAGEIISVGGPAKSKNMSKLGEHLKRMVHVGGTRGVPVQHYFEAGTPDPVIRLAKKWLGEENVFIFKVD